MNFKPVQHGRFILPFTILGRLEFESRKEAQDASQLPRGPLSSRNFVMRARLVAAVAGLVPGALVFFGSRALAFATVCDCWSTRMAGTVACLCLGVVVGLAVAIRVLDRLAPPVA